MVYDVMRTMQHPSEFDTSDIASQLQFALEAFEERFGRPATLAATAPGRVNLIGEHTDYNDGFVLPLAINRGVIVVGDYTPDDQANAIWHSLDLQEEYEVDMTRALKPIDDPEWVNYPLGVFEEFRQHQVELPQIDLVMTSSVPIGSGLSSSAALCVAVATLFESAIGLELDPLRKAMWCQRAEHEFPKVPCGLMDPTIATLAVEDHALFMDCRSHDTKLVPMPNSDDAVLLIVNTNVKHSLASSEYATREQECKQAVQLIREVFNPDVESLRDVTLNDLHQLRDLMDKTLFNRTLHVVNENIRTIESVEALTQGDLSRLGQYMFASHVSLRDEYAVSCEELDTIVELAGELNESMGGSNHGVFGARMTGGGFGGCAIVLCKPESAGLVTEHITNGYRARFDRAPTIFSTTAADGATAIDLDALFGG